MRTLFTLTTALAVLALAVWAYRETDRTQSALREVDALRAEIAELRVTRTVLSAEWAYLNRPDRLNDLAELNFDRLRLLPLSPEHFADISEIPYPPEVLGLATEETAE